jgi:hypothetical protein
LWKYLIFVEVVGSNPAVVERCFFFGPVLI